MRTALITGASKGLGLALADRREARVAVRLREAERVGAPVRQLARVLVVPALGVADKNEPFGG